MLTLKQVTWTAPGGSSVLKGIDLVVPDHKLVVITGPNGGGKTTLAKLISGLEKPDSGRIYLDETDITDLDVTQRGQNGHQAMRFSSAVRFKGLTVANLLELAAGKPLSEDEACGYLVQVGLCGPGLY